jgi:hypothetical protein
VIVVTPVNTLPYWINDKIGTRDTIMRRRGDDPAIGAARGDADAAAGRLAEALGGYSISRRWVETEALTATDG